MTEPTTEAGSGMLATALRLVEEQGAVYLMGEHDLNRERARAVNAALDKVAAAARAFDGTYVDCGGGYGFRDDDLIDRSDVLLAIEAARPKP